jgi:hypothetical protein
LSKSSPISYFCSQEYNDGRCREVSRGSEMIFSELSVLLSSLV